ncbi:pilus assembly protein TadG-related protein [Streptomyces sp. H27-D2]|uniref:pilus assembly protein TadG-related protein n=1 Tax=Streptomyces sp. H27-D2 TaxID=3046304 RepID=UPI002DBD5ED3|nr:pilus assembly protein TadG-related protein [Streptomyces sp. H27-D2]MEC4016560.1 pilus assembly protein TadG-related protein [Streptomyces sp. H27-D2]
MTLRKNDDAGQAFPIYITVVAGLLFLAFAYFAVGQAAVSKNGAQGAADAAALAAAQEARDELKPDMLLKALLSGQTLDDFLNGNPPGAAAGCFAAGRFAGENDAELVGGAEGCSSLPGWRNGFSVKVRTLKPIGDSLVDGTETRKPTAKATAVIESRCDFVPDEPEAPDEGDEGDTGGDPPAGQDDEGAEKPPRGSFHCDFGILPLDPESDDPFPDLADLFSVRLDD